MKVDTHRNGATCWMDLGTPDIDGTMKFYGGLLGWTFAEGNPETGFYRQFSTNGNVVGGAMPLQQPEQPTAWTAYFKTDNVDDSVKLAESLGATTMMPGMDVMTFGRMAILIDTVGAAFGLWQPYDMKGSDVIDEHGAWAWTELMTSDIDKSEEFYSKLLGWTVADASKGSPQYREMKVGDQSVAGIMARMDEIPAEVPNYWGLYYCVDSMDKAIDYLKNNGATIVNGPMTIDPGTFVNFIDPQGAAIGLLEPAKH